VFLNICKDNGYRKSIFEKFGTDNIAEAINYAMTYRLID
jgi:DNA-binding CsgD family transcriptional regulator